MGLGREKGIAQSEPRVGGSSVSQNPPESKLWARRQYLLQSRVCVVSELNNGENKISEGTAEEV